MVIAVKRPKAAKDAKLPRHENKNSSLDISALRARLDGADGRRFWRSLGELAGTPAFTESLHHEFPNDPEKENPGVNRRDVVKLMAASAALAGLSSCTKLPTQKIVPYVRAPEEIIPGKPLFYATAMTLGGVATGTARMAAQASGLPENDLGATEGRKHVELLIDRYATYAAAVRKSIDEADDHNDKSTADLFTQVSRTADKHLWFLEAHTR